MKKALTAYLGVLTIIIFGALSSQAHVDLSKKYYHSSCPQIAVYHSPYYVQPVTWKLALEPKHSCFRMVYFFVFIRFLLLSSIIIFLIKYRKDKYTYLIILPFIIGMVLLFYMESGEPDNIFVEIIQSKDYKIHRGIVPPVDRPSF